MKCEFQSVEELIEYVEQEAERMAKEILEKNGMSVSKFELKSGAATGIWTRVRSLGGSRPRPG